METYIHEIFIRKLCQKFLSEDVEVNRHFKTEHT